MRVLVGDTVKVDVGGAVSVGIGVSVAGLVGTGVGDAWGVLQAEISIPIIKTKAI